MKRILGMVVAIAGVLAFSSAATAALVVFDVSGTTGAWSRSGDANAAIPGPPTNGGPCGATGMGSYTTGSSLNCFRYAFAAGSSVTLDITGSAVTMMGGTLNTVAVTPIVFGTIVLTTVGTTTIHGTTAYTPAATGILSGDSILWASGANVTSTGTITCNGPNCGLVSLPVGIPVPIQPTLSGLTNSTAVKSLALGQWDLDALHLSIVGSTTAVTAWSNVAGDGNRRVSAFTFGNNLLGLPVPEPASAVLVLLGLGALALRSRKA